MSKVKKSVCYHGEETLGGRNCNAAKIGVKMVEEVSLNSKPHAHSSIIGAFYIFYNFDMYICMQHKIHCTAGIHLSKMKNRSFPSFLISLTYSVKIFKCIC